MTNPTLPDVGAGLPPELRALAPVGGKRRPVRVVEHPVFRAARARLASRRPLSARAQVVSVNRPAPATARACHPARPALEAT